MNVAKKVAKIREKSELDNRVLRQIRDRYTDRELSALAGGSRPIVAEKGLVKSFYGEEMKFLVMSDTHIGSAYDNPKWIQMAFDEGKRMGCQFLIHAGDVVDGMGMDKKGYVYDLRKIGYRAQKDEAIRILSEWKKPAYVISGNHDLWFYKENGADIVADICQEIGWTYLGQGAGTLNIGGIRIDPFHGEDNGGGYAHSYRMQQIIRSWTGGDKPHILITGHDHKSLYLFYRFVHGIGAGACGRQSRFFKVKRIEHHSGFWVVSARVNKLGVASLTSTWYPFYE